MRLTILEREGKQIRLALSVRNVGITSSAGDEIVHGQETGQAGRAEGVDETAAVISGETIGQLIQMQNEFSELRALRERECASSQTLAGLLKNAVLELETTIPVSRGALSSAFPSIREGWLSPDSKVVIIDSSGTNTSIPLENLPPHTIASILQDCAVRMNELMSRKLDRVGRSVDLLEKAVRELSHTGKSSDQGAPPVSKLQGKAEGIELQKEEGKAEGIELQKEEGKESPDVSGTKAENGPSNEEGKCFSYSASFEKH